MSGECLCGAFAHPGEFAEIQHHWPDVAAYIQRLEVSVTNAGCRFAKWGDREAHRRKQYPAGLELDEDLPLFSLCHSCSARREEEELVDGSKSN